MAVRFAYTCPRCGHEQEFRNRVSQRQRRCPVCGEPVTPEEIDRQMFAKFQAKPPPHPAKSGGEITSCLGALTLLGAAAAVLLLYVAATSPAGPGRAEYQQSTASSPPPAPGKAPPGQAAPEGLFGGDDAGPPPSPPTAPYRPPGPAPQLSYRGQRLPWLPDVFDAIKATPWGRDLKPIPATVVDAGPLKFVPYQSFRAGPHELNVYGDPDYPCCIELGLRDPLVRDTLARKRCLKTVGDLLLPNDRGMVGLLKLEKDLRKAEMLTFEITPPEAEDSEGGWWISVYDESRVNLARASEEEIRRISVPKPDPQKPAATSSPDPSGPQNTWRPEDYAQARPSRGGSGGRVYVSGYTRKNGTYVAPHTRAAPGSGRLRK
jgi:DNA-directed RNA polymerase subunit RPC12/RpoP